MTSAKQPRKPLIIISGCNLYHWKMVFIPRHKTRARLVHFYIWIFHSIILRLIFFSFIFWIHNFFFKFFFLFFFWLTDVASTSIKRISANKYIYIHTYACIWDVPSFLSSSMSWFPHAAHIWCRFIAIAIFSLFRAVFFFFFFIIHITIISNSYEFGLGYNGERISTFWKTVWETTAYVTFCYEILLFFVNSKVSRELLTAYTKINK